MMRTVKREGSNDHIIIMLHGTGGKADSLFNLGHFIDPNATYIGVEGDVMENGMRRYFERYPDGSFKLKSLAEASHKLHQTILKIVGDNKGKQISVMGYSNGANILINLLKEYENIPIHDALLYHPSPVRSERPFKTQKNLKVFITSGANDPFINDSACAAM